MTSKANIVYILADDLGYGDLGCYGAKKIQTPNIDRLAHDGLRFTEAHAPSAVCTPTRYGLLTGRYCFRSSLKSGVLWGHSQPIIEKNRSTVASFLKAQGYATACIGKWHLGLGWAQQGETVDYTQPLHYAPTHAGFDYFYGISASLDMPPYCFIENDRVVEIPSVPKEPVDFSQRERGGLMTPGWKDHQVNRIHTEKATAFIAAQAECEPDQPFFLYMALTGPHTPWTADEAFKGQSILGPRGDMILELDWTVGEIIGALERAGLRDNTMIVFTSDNGPHPRRDEVVIHGHRPAGELRGQKADIWDGGHRVPFIVNWPKTIAPGTTDEFICLTDLYATCSDLLDTPLPEGAGEDSVSMLPVLTGKEALRKSIIHHSLHGLFAIRRGNWKLIHGKGGGGFKDQNSMVGIPDRGTASVHEAPGQLYQMSNDVSERNNVYRQHPDVVDSLMQELETIVGDDLQEAESTGSEFEL